MVDNRVSAQHAKCLPQDLASQLVTFLAPLVRKLLKVPRDRIDKAIDLVNQVRKSLKDVGGAASEYQDAVIELDNLATTLSHLEALQPDEDNLQHVNAIRAMALACRFPLEQFKSRMMRYESFLGPWAKRNSPYAAGQKAKWSIKFGDEVGKFRAVIAAKHASINLLLGMQLS